MTACDVPDEGGGGGGRMSLLPCSVRCAGGGARWGAEPRISFARTDAKD